MMSMLILLTGCKMTQVIGIEQQKTNSKNIEAQNNNSVDIEEQISKAKLVSTYGDMSTIDEMDTVTFGSYSQSSTSADKLEPIEWIVLERDSKNNRALLLSKYILDVRFNVYKSGEKNTTWENSNIRTWLNNEFYNTAFTEEEKNKIKEVQLVNEDNDDYMTLGGRDTMDKIFLLSISEARKYFSNGDNLGNKDQLVRAGAAKGTQYAEYRKLGKIRKDKQDEYEEWMLENSAYNLRSPGGAQEDTAAVGPDAIISTSGFVGSGLNRRGVRPAMWIEYEK